MDPIDELKSIRVANGFRVNPLLAKKYNLRDVQDQLNNEPTVEKTTIVLTKKF